MGTDFKRSHQTSRACICLDLENKSPDIRSMDLVMQACQAVTNMPDKHPNLRAREKGERVLIKTSDIVIRATIASVLPKGHAGRSSQSSVNKDLFEYVLVMEGQKTDPDSCFLTSQSYHALQNCPNLYDDPDCPMLL